VADRKAFSSSGGNPTISKGFMRRGNLIGTRHGQTL
jgi:hypothetical protein